jgi:hypothetical protein
MKTHDRFRILHFAAIVLIVSTIATDYFGFEPMLSTNCNMFLCFKHQHSQEFYCESLALLLFCPLAIGSFYDGKIGLWFESNVLKTVIVVLIGVFICVIRIAAQPFEFVIMSTDLSEEQLSREYRTLLLYVVTYLAVVLVAYTESKISRQVKIKQERQASRQLS